MKNLTIATIATIATVTAAALTGAILGQASPALAAPTGAGNADDTISRLGPGQPGDRQQAL